LECSGNFPDLGAVPSISETVREAAEITEHLPRAPGMCAAMRDLRMK